MAEAAAGVVTFTVACNTIRKSLQDQTTFITSYHNRGHLNPDLVPNKSYVNREVDPIKLIEAITRSFHSARYILEPDGIYSSEYEANFTAPIGTLQSGQGTGNYVYIKIRKETRLLFKRHYQFYVVTLSVTAVPRLHVQNGQNSQSFPNRTIQNSTVARDW